MVEAEGSSRIEAGAAIRTIATRNRDAPSASHAHDISSTQFCQYVYSKPGALVLGYRLSVAGASIKIKDLATLIGRAMVWTSRTN